MTEAFALRALLADEAQGTEEPGTVDGLCPRADRGEWAVQSGEGRLVRTTYLSRSLGRLHLDLTPAPKGCTCPGSLANDGPIKRTSAGTTEAQEDEWRLTRRRLGG